MTSSDHDSTLADSASSETGVKRTHDAFYLNVDPKLPPKDSFKTMAGLIAKYKSGTGSRALKIADIGCATGAFPSFLQQQFPSDRVEGFEYLQPLVDASKLNFSNIQVTQGSLLERDMCPAHSFDVITLLGVLSIFDNVEAALANLCHWIKPGGKLFVHGMFNPHELDVFVKYRPASAPGQHLESGWNIVSQATAARVVGEHGAKQVTFHKFEISVDLQPNPDDPVRSWTEILSDGTRQIVNGLWLKQPQYILEADL